MRSSPTPNVHRGERRYHVKNNHHFPKQQSATGLLSVHCEVRTECVYIRVVLTVVVSGRAMGPTVGRRPVTADVRIRSEASRCEIVMHKVALDKVSLQAPLFSPVIIIPPMLHIHLHLHFALTRTKTGNLPKKECCFGNRDALYRKVLSHSVKT